MGYIVGSEERVGYRVRVEHREPFAVTGFTLIIPPKVEGVMIPQFWREVAADGRLDALKGVKGQPSWTLGIESWDPECPKHGQRYTICAENYSEAGWEELGERFPLHTIQLNRSDWMCFELTQEQLETRFWDDDPYRMMKLLGYRFHAGDLGLGVHLDAYPPDYGQNSTKMEFWITVTPAKERPTR